MNEKKMKLLCIIIQFSLPWAFRPGSADVSPCVSLQVFLAFYFVPLLTIRKLQRKLSASKCSSEYFQKKLKAVQIYGIHLIISYSGQKLPLQV